MEYRVETERYDNRSKLTIWPYCHNPFVARALVEGGVLREFPVASECSSLFATAVAVMDGGRVKVTIVRSTTATPPERDEIEAIVAACERVVNEACIEADRVWATVKAMGKAHGKRVS